MVHVTTSRPGVTVTADGRVVVSHAGSRLLADLAEVTGLTEGYSQVFTGLRERRSRHDPGRVLVDVTVMLADGGEAISDLAVLREQAQVFGSVASSATAWRVLDRVDEALLGRLRAARARARERAWLARAELGRELPASTAGGRVVPGLVVEVDATLVVAHSDKERPPRRSRGPSAPTRCSYFSTTPARRWPGCSARVTPGRTPQPTTSRSPTWRWRRSPTKPGTEHRS